MMMMMRRRRRRRIGVDAAETQSPLPLSTGAFLSGHDRQAGRPVGVPGRRSNTTGGIAAAAAATVVAVAAVAEPPIGPLKRYPPSSALCYHLRWRVPMQA